MQLSIEKLEAIHSVAQQANAQGITWLASSGDSGAASCDGGLDLEAWNGAWVAVPASFHEVTAVGGTMLTDDTGDYWNANPTQPGTARSYIPEIAWNETPLGGGLAASGGGASYIYGRPYWQTGPGVPGIDARMVPDVSLAGAWYRNPYMIVSGAEPWWWGGTSAATPFFAGIVSILNQYLESAGLQAKPGLGNINPKLYELARTTSGVFHDITAGDNFVPCKLGSADCPFDRYGFIAGPGYDPVTGLGSLDVYNFAVKWAAALSAPAIPTTSLTLTANPATMTANGSTILTATVKPSGGAMLSTGTVSFRFGPTQLGTASLFASDSAAAATFTVSGSQLAGGVSTIRASYSGSPAFSSSRAP
jgi:subtilase family serine protease